MAREARRRSRLLTVATLVTGLLGGGWIARLFDTRAPALPPALPSERRRLCLQLVIEITAADGVSWREERWSDPGAADFASIEVMGRTLALTLCGNASDTLGVRAVDSSAATRFEAAVNEGTPALWRLPQTEGMATLRVSLQRRYTGT